MLEHEPHQFAVEPRTTRIIAVTFGFALFGVLIFCVRGTRAHAQGSETGETLYKTKCIACHGADGSGDTPVGKSLKSADLRSPEVQKKSDAELAEFIATGKGNMPSFRSSTSDEEIHIIIGYVRAFAPKKPKKAVSKGT